MEQLTKKKQIVSVFLKNNILVSRTILDQLNKPNLVNEWHDALEQGIHPKDLLEKQQTQQATEQATKQDKCQNELSAVKLIWEYDDKPGKKTVQDFIGLFNQRYKALHAMLQNRQELQNLTSISRLKTKKDWEKMSVIGMVTDKSTTKNGHIVLVIEDLTGITKAIIKKEEQELYNTARDIVLDEVIGISGASGGEAIFANTIIIPDIPHKSPKTTPDEVYAAVLSCIHAGSSIFEHEKFNNFIKWVNGEEGTQEQKEKASKLKYIFICGDVVDGIGIYPGQEKELAIKDIKEQYNECAKLLNKIRKDVTLIIGPGNHDAGRIAEPQPKLSKNYAAALYELQNAVFVCNPCVINLHASETFSGLNILMYHGYSFDDYSECVPSIKESGTHLSDRAPLVMKFLLQRRHLAPQNKSTLYIPDPRADPLVIESVPDLFFAGHIHKAGTTEYRGTTIAAGSCFQSKTEFQEKVGHEPEPGVVPIVNLKTRDVTMMRF